MADAPQTGEPAPAPTTEPPAPAPVPASSPAPAPAPAPVATPQPAPATNENGKIELDPEDYKNIISQRDRATEAAKSSEGRDAFVEQLAQERAIDDFLTENKDKYPDLKPEDLKHVWDPDGIKSEADRLQRRLQDHAQNTLMNIENAGPPVLSAAEQAEKLEQLKTSGDPQAFQKMLALKLPA